MSDYNSLIPVLMQFKPGDKVALKVRRDGKYQEFPVILMKRSEMLDAATKRPTTRPSAK